MEEQINFSYKETVVMKLLHYFITDKNYKPVILHGVEDEIWLENMDENYKIIRIVYHYIHNDEQFSFDLFKTKKILKSIKKKTVSLSLNTLSIFTDLGDNVTLKSDEHIDCVCINEPEDLAKIDFVKEAFPDIKKKVKFKEEGVDLFLRITSEINQKNKKEAEKVDKIFAPKVPIITYILMAINILIFAYGLLAIKQDYLINKFATYGPLIKGGDYYRLFTGAFLHADIFHLLFNMYALYVIGSQAESFFGKFKYLTIYVFSIFTASLLSMLLNVDSASVGASGAIFGLLGALLYFGYHYRVYLGNVLVRQIMPIIVINLMFGFLTPGVDNFGHIGGLIGGVLISMGLGLKTKSTVSERINGLILSCLLLGFLIFMNFFYA